MKLFLDDVREPPNETWTWVRTAAEARAFLESVKVTECSLDHDLELFDVELPLPEDPDELLDLFQAARIEGRPVESGLDLVHWMVEHDRVPAKVTIHSWNDDGAHAMAARLNYFGHKCTIAPYVPPEGRKA